MNFSAVILAGGKSSRMGRDKAFIEIGGQTLLARQIQLVREVGATEIFISGRANTDYSAFDCRVLLDELPAAGPLAGIERALAAATAPLLFVLAVDLPEMDAKFLRRLAAHCSGNAGVIPRAAGNVEPLAAVYPKVARALAIKMIEQQNYALREFAGNCVESGLAVFVELSESDLRFFKNCNSPEDISYPAQGRSAKPGWKVYPIENQHLSARTSRTGIC